MRHHILGADMAHPLDAVFINSPLKNYDELPRHNDFTLPVLGLGYIATYARSRGLNVGVLDVESLGIGLSHAAALINETLLRRLTSSPWRKALAALLRPAFREARRDLDYAEQGGALLLGINGVVIVSHGRSSQQAIASAVGVAKQSIEGDVPGTIARLMAALAPVAQPAAAIG